MKYILRILVGLIFLLFILPVSASVKDYIDMPDGHNVSVGLFGMSYDYSVFNFGIGTFIGTGISLSPYEPSTRINLGIRAHYKFFEWEDLSAGIMTGVIFDPGNINNDERGKFIPDIGVGVSYHFWDTGFIIRLNVTITSLKEGLLSSYSSYNDDQERVPNFLQTLTVGPNTSLEIAYILNDNASLTIGGGSICGIRMNF